MFKLKATILLFFAISCACTNVYSQNYPVYNHFYNNQFIYNPAEAGSLMRSSVFVTHRQQWRGVEGAPVVSSLSFSTPFDGTNVAIGVNVSNFTRGLLSTTDALITYGYAIPMGGEKSIRFGLSGGIISNNVDFSQVDNPDDPALIPLLNKTMQLAGNFGIKYQSNGLNIGVSLPQLFEQQFLYESSFENYNATPFDNVVIMAYYRKRVDGYFKTKKRGRSRSTKKVESPYAPLELHFMYRYSKYLENQFEAMAKLNLSPAFWVGASYRQGYGPSGNLGFNINDFTFAYAYEPAFEQVNELLKGSHEFQLSIRFGKVASLKIKEKKPDLGTRANETPKESEHKARYQAGDDSGASGGGFKDSSGKMHIVAIKTFDDFTKADAYKQYLKKRKIDARMYVDKVYNNYHIYLYESGKMADAKKELKRLKKNRKYKSAKIITISGQ